HVRLGPTGSRNLTSIGTASATVKGVSSLRLRRGCVSKASHAVTAAPRGGASNDCNRSRRRFRTAARNSPIKSPRPTPPGSLDPGDLLPRLLVLSDAAGDQVCQCLQGRAESLPQFLRLCREPLDARRSHAQRWFGKNERQHDRAVGSRGIGTGHALETFPVWF